MKKQLISLSLDYNKATSILSNTWLPGSATPVLPVWPLDLSNTPFNYLYKINSQGIRMIGDL